MPFSASIHKRHAYGKDAYTYFPVLIVGAGESGVAMGCRLKEALGTDQFRIFDRQSGIGGTWWINRYPGVACDIPALFYSFSFALKKDWSTIHPSGSEIAGYMAEVCEQYQIVDKIQFHTDVKQLRWIDDDEEWEVTLSHLVPGTGDLSQYDRDQLAAREGRERVYVKTEIVRAKVVVSGVGGLVEPKAWPSDIPGIEQFEGDIMHTARWNSDVDLQNKNVVVVGSGCSAAQVVPQLAKPEANVRSVTQIMRTPPWVEPDLLTPAGLASYQKWVPYLFTKIPGLARTARNIMFWVLENNFYALFSDTAYGNLMRPRVEQRCLRVMRSLVPEKYHDVLTPNYPLGCKRRVINGDWYRSLNAPNVELTVQPITQVHARSVTIGPGSYYPPNAPQSREAREVPADVIVLGNGFETNQWLHPLKVIGRNNVNMEDVWAERGGAQAYLGLAMDQFPNFFMLFGPNTATGHTSVIFATEMAIKYSLNFIKPILDGHVSAYEVKEEAERSWTRQIQNQLQKTVFRRGVCSSWYSTGNGWNSSTYPYTQFHYWYRCAFPVWRDWSANWTQKGLALQRIRRAVRVFLLVCLLAGLLFLRLNPNRQLVMEALSAGKNWILAKASLLLSK